MSPAQRKAVYTLVAALAVAFAAFGVFTQEQSEALADVIKATVVLFPLLLARSNVPK